MQRLMQKGCLRLKLVEYNQGTLHSMLSATSFFYMGILFYWVLVASRVLISNIGPMQKLLGSCTFNSPCRGTGTYQKNVLRKACRSQLNTLNLVFTSTPLELTKLLLIPPKPAPLFYKFPHKLRNWYYTRIGGHFTRFLSISHINFLPHNLCKPLEVSKTCDTRLECRRTTKWIVLEGVTNWVGWIQVRSSIMGLQLVSNRPEKQPA